MFQLLISVQAQSWLDESDVKDCIYVQLVKQVSQNARPDFKEMQNDIRQLPQQNNGKKLNIRAIDFWVKSASMVSQVRLSQICRPDSAIAGRSFAKNLYGRRYYAGMQFPVPYQPVVHCTF